MQVVSTKFKFRAAAAKVMRTIVRKNGVSNLTIKIVKENGEDRFIIVRQENT